MACSSARLAPKRCWGVREKRGARVLSRYQLQAVGEVEVVVVVMVSVREEEQKGRGRGALRLTAARAAAGVEGGGGLEEVRKSLGRSTASLLLADTVGEKM